MKKYLLFAICLILALSSCKKGSNIPANTISATVDGVNESFNTGPVALLGSSVQLNSSLSISGSNGSGTNSDRIAITIESNSTITKGTYTNGGTNNSGLTSIVYNKAPFSLTNPNIYTTDVNGNYPTTVTITSISSTSIQGTFSGTLLFSNGTTTKTITDGKFNLSLK
jgi:hypothetical protein